MSHDGTPQSKIELKPVPLLARDFDANFQEIRDVLEELRASLGVRGASAEQIGSIELLLSEVLTNVAKHAYAEVRRGQIRLALTCDENSVYVDVSDYGAALPEGVLPSGRPADPRVAIGAQPESGFGWILIRALAQDIRYTREGSSNRLRFRVAIGPRHNGPGAAESG